MQCNLIAKEMFRRRPKDSENRRYRRLLFALMFLGRVMRHPPLPAFIDSIPDFIQMLIDNSADDANLDVVLDCVDLCIVDP